MNFWKYINRSPEQFDRDYLQTKLVTCSKDRGFPLNLYTYGRECVHTNAWDEVITKCRGIIVNRDTGEIVARPFEKFFNLADPNSGFPNATTAEEPVVWEKMDGFLCTGYKWEGKWWCASKGSFHSPHAKWATAQIQKSPEWPEGYTPVFEGITSNLRIVLDYGKREELVLLALVNNETGEELNPYSLTIWASKNGLSTPRDYHMTYEEAYAQSLEDVTGEEGFVLTWYRQGQTPYRLKLKYVDYLRLHRLITGVSPKRIFEAMRDGFQADIDEMLNNSTPGFNHFVTKWKGAIEAEYVRIDTEAKRIFLAASEDLKYMDANFVQLKKEYALRFTRPENKEFEAVCFAMLNGKRVSEVIWKKVGDAQFMKGVQPMVDAYSI
jgi:RNA ligase